MSFLLYEISDRVSLSRGFITNLPSVHKKSAHPPWRRCALFSITEPYRKGLRRPGKTPRIGDTEKGIQRVILLGRAPFAKGTCIQQDTIFRYFSANREAPAPAARGLLGVSLGVRRNHVQKPELRLSCLCKK